MGFWDGILRAGSGSVARFFTPNVTYIGFPGWDEGGFTDGLSRESVIKLWRTQPYLRTVVAFRARNVAQLGLHVYTREADGGRTRDRTSVLAQLLEHVDGEMTTYDLLYSISGDLDLFDRSYLLFVADSNSPVGFSLRRLPPTWVREIRKNRLHISHYEVQASESGNPVEIPASQMIRFTGYDPASVLGCSPAVDSLRETLSEQVESARYRAQVWKRGGRVSAVLQRPAQAPRWSDAAREAFRSDWYAKFTGNGSNAGGTPILEDGMTLNRIDFNAQEQQYAEVAKLSLNTVASAFHTHPSMIGQGEAPYAAIRAYGKMLYTETLGPTLRQISARLNKDLLRLVGMDPTSVYLEFNLQEKLSGDFEEQASILSTSTGAPWMTRNEARARVNLPSLPGGDELVVPLNVLTGGQASPTDAGTQNEVPNPVEEDRPKRALPPVRGKGFPRSKDDTPDLDTLAQERIVKFFKRQARSVLSRGGSWDADRWNEELGDDLLELLSELSSASARKTLLDAGLDPADYQVERTLKYLRKAAELRAQAINDSIESEVEEAENPEDVLNDDRAESRGAKVATSVVAFAVGFGATEAARQSGAGKATKTWVVTSSNPRPSHASMDGETVPLDSEFSNGLKWPGAFGDADEVAGCSCELVINFP